MIPFLGMSKKPNTLTPEEGEGGGGVDEPHTEDPNAATTGEVTLALEVLSIGDVASNILMQIQAGNYESACEQAANWENTCKLIHKGCDNQHAWLILINSVFGKDAPIPPKDRNISNRNWFFELCNRHRNMDETTKQLAGLRTRIANLRERTLRTMLNLKRRHKVAFQDKLKLLNFSELFQSEDKEEVDREAKANEAKFLQIESTLEQLYKKYDSYDRSMNRLTTLYNLGAEKAELFRWQRLLVEEFEPSRPSAINFYREFLGPSPPKNDSDSDSETETESDSFKRFHAHYENFARITNLAIQRQREGVHMPTRKEEDLVEFREHQQAHRVQREDRKLLLLQQAELAQKMMLDVQQRLE